MLKRFGLAGLLFATLAVAPLTIAAQDWNHNQRSAYSDHQAGRNNVRRDQGRYMQYDRDDRGRDTWNRNMRYRNTDDRDFRGYGERREWNR